MDQSLQELQRHCDANPTDLLSAQRLFNQLHRMNNPLFAELNEFLSIKEKVKEVNDLQLILAKLPSEGQWSWLTGLIQKKIENWPAEFFIMSGVKFRRFPQGTAWDNVQCFISDINYYFDQASNSDSVFTELCSKFKSARRFRLILEDREYEAFTDCFPAKIDQLALTGTLKAINSILVAVKETEVHTVALTLEGDAYPPQTLKIAPAICKNLSSLRIDGRLLNTTIPYSPVESVFSTPAPKLQTLGLRNLQLTESVLNAATSKLILPSLSNFESINNNLGEITAFTRSTLENDKNQISQVTLVDSSLSISQFHELLQYLKSSQLPSLWIALSGASNEEIKRLFEGSGILTCTDLDLRISQVTGSLDYSWLERLASFGLKRFDVNLEPGRDLSDADHSQLNATRDRILAKRRFPMLKTLNIGHYNDH
ncbi:MAG: hypothetical protein P1V97_35055 [Planctomycetota bacterium]|nr:hypothetical protein [Planctomycetota bacterium]